MQTFKCMIRLRIPCRRPCKQVRSFLHIWVPLTVARSKTKTMASRAGGRFSKKCGCSIHEENNARLLNWTTAKKGKMAINTLIKHGYRLEKKKIVRSAWKKPVFLKG